MLIALRKIYPVIRPMLPMAVMGCLLAGVTAFAQIALLAVSGWFIAAMALAGIAGAAMNYFSPAAVIRALAITRTAGRYAERLSTHDAALRFVAALRPWIFERIGRMPAETHDRMHSGSMFDLLRSDIDHLEKFYLNGFVPLVVAATGVISAAGLLAIYHPALSVGLLCVLVFCGIVLPYLGWRGLRGAARDLAARTVSLRMSAVDAADGFGELMVYGGLQGRLGDLSRDQAAFLDLQRNVQQRESAGAALQGWLISATSFGFLAVLIGLFENTGARDLNPALLAALPLLVLACAETLAPVFTALNAWESAGYALQRLLPVMNAGMQPESHEEAAAQAGLSLSGVSFRYAESGADAIHDISVSLRTGECLAVVGASGSGKSTLIDIIAGVYKPLSGAVSGGGLSQVSVAEQSPYVFAGTVRSNLLFGNPSATGAAMDNACRVAGFDDVVAGLSDGYDTRLGMEGMTALSGGQMRRLSIARALLKDSAFLLLDEPDDGLDAVQAVAVVDRIRAECRDRKQGLIVVTHNASILRGFDRVLYLEEGREGRAGHTGDMIDFREGDD